MENNEEKLDLSVADGDVSRADSVCNRSSADDATCDEAMCGIDECADRNCTSDECADACEGCACDAVDGDETGDACDCVSVANADASSDDNTAAPDYSDYDDAKLLHADGNFDEYEYFSNLEEKAKRNTPSRHVRTVFDFLEMLTLVTMGIILCFAFIFRLNTVSGPSMENTLHTGEYLFVSDLFYDPEPGDIVVIHDLTKGSYAEPIVKRIIATAGQTVDIDFTTWTLTVDGEVVDESSYRKIDGRLLTSTIDFPITVEENTVFVMGDNRNHSADSRLSEIGLIDERSIIGKVYARIFPLSKFTVFKNPYND